MTAARDPEKKLRKFYAKYRDCEPWEWPVWHPLYVDRHEFFILQCERAEFEQRRREREAKARQTADTV